MRTSYVCVFDAFIIECVAAIIAAIIVNTIPFGYCIEFTYSAIVAGLRVCSAKRTGRPQKTNLAVVAFGAEITTSRSDCSKQGNHHECRNEQGCYAFHTFSSLNMFIFIRSLAAKSLSSGRYCGFISFRLGTGNGFTIDLKVKLVTVVLCWVYVIIQRKIMSSIFCPKQAVFSY